jgi:hypothetical protein
VTEIVADTFLLLDKPENENSIIRKESVVKKGKISILDADIRNIDAPWCGNK